MLNLGGFQFSTGARPVWESSCYKELVLADSLAGNPKAPAPPPPQKVSLATLVDSLTIVSSQLATLNKSSAGAAIKQSVARVHSTFSRCVEMCGSVKTVHDHTTFYELLTNFVAQVKALTPGSSVLMPGGFKGGNLVYVLHCES